MKLSATPVLVALLFVLPALVLSTATSKTPANLPILNADLQGVTVSGISSGGMMSAQFHLAHSAYVKGSGIIAGGPAGCARGYLTFATTECMSSPQDLEFDQVTDAVNQLVKQKRVDTLNNIQNSNVYVFAGTQDTVVAPQCGSIAAHQFDTYGANLKTEFAIPAEHSYVTVDKGNNCNFKGTPYINHCNYNQAYISLSHLFGENLKEAVTAKPENLIEFNQSKFFDSAMSSMADSAYIYVPTACKDLKTKCRLHINFHGCEQSVSDIGLTYIQSIGVIEVAEANNIIVLFPQTIKSAVYPYNPKGCWDWWGYTEWSAMLAPTGYYILNSAGLNYFSQDGIQIKAVWKMAQQITQNFAESSNSTSTHDTVEYSPDLQLIPLIYDTPYSKIEQF